MRIQDFVQKTCLRRWTIGKSGERGSGISVLPARHDDDDDDLIIDVLAIWVKFLSNNIWFWLLQQCFDSLSITSWIRPYYMNISEAFKSFIEWSNAQHVSTPSTKYNSFHCLNCSGHMICALTKHLIYVTKKSLCLPEWMSKLFGLVWFDGISTIVGYLMPNLSLYI